MPGAQNALLRALAASAGAEPGVEAEHLAYWSSATFVGARHRLTLRLPAAAAARLVEGAGTIAPAGHLLIELGVRRPEAELVEIAAFTVEEA